MAAKHPKSTRKPNANRRDTQRVVRWLQAGAVATGVGAAVISGQGVAWATTDTDTDSSASGDTAPGGGDTTTTGQSAATTGDVDPSAAQENDADDSDGEGGEGGEGGTGPAEGQTVAAGDSPPATITAQTNVSADDEEEEQETDQGPDGDTIETPEIDSDDADTQEPSENNSEHRTDGTETTLHRSLRSNTESQTPSTTDPSNPPEEDAGFTTLATTFADTAASAIVLRPPTATVTVEEVTPAPAAEFRPIRQLVVGVLGLFGFSPNPAPGAPTPNPLLEAVWALYRRVESVFANERPTVNAASVTESILTDEGDVIIEGAVDFDDANNDPLRYSSTDGTHGTVTANDDGTWTYTPTDPAYTGDDTFTITATDAGWHLHGLGGLLSPGQGHTRTATIKINLVAADNDAPVINDVKSEPGTGNTWTVTVDATDPDDDDVTIIVEAIDADHVTISSVEGEPTKFTVTVTDATWALANPGKQLSVTVTATDGVASSTAPPEAIGTVSNVVALGISIPALPAGLSYTNYSANSEHIALLRSDGTVVVVGSNTTGQLNIPPQNEGVIYTAVAAGSGHTVLLRADGTAFTVGWNSYGQLTTPPPGPGVTIKQIAAGFGSTSYLLSDGTVVAYGLWTDGLASLPPLPAGVTYQQIYAGDTTNFLLRSDGKVDSFGYNSFGQISVPPLPAGVTYTQVGAGFNHTVFLRSDGTVATSGTNVFGQRNIPPLEEGVKYTQVAAGLFHTVLLRSDGTVVTAGTMNGSGQLNIPTLPEGVVYTKIGASREITLLTIDYA